MNFLDKEFNHQRFSLFQQQTRKDKDKINRDFYMQRFKK